MSVQGAEFLSKDKQLQCEGQVACGTPVPMLRPEDVISYEALYNSMMKCKRGVMWKGSVAFFTTTI